MAKKELVYESGVTKEKGYLYYVKGKESMEIWRSQMARAGKGGGGAEKLESTGKTREEGFLYFLDSDANVRRSPMARGRKK